MTRTLIRLRTESYEVLLPNRDWRQLLRRFNLKNKEYNEDSDEWEILVPCICENYGNDCFICPFGKAVFHKDEGIGIDKDENKDENNPWFAIPCFEVLKEVTGLLLDEVHMGIHVVWWTDDSLLAPQTIQAIHNWLKTGEEIKLGEV